MYRRAGVYVTTVRMESDGNKMEKLSSADDSVGSSFLSVLWRHEFLCVWVGKVDSLITVLSRNSAMSTKSSGPVAREREREDEFRQTSMTFHAHRLTDFDKLIHGDHAIAVEVQAVEDDIHSGLDILFVELVK